MLHPAILKEAVAGIYTTLHQKLHVLDPDELAASLRKNVWEPLMDPLHAIDPAALKAQLDALFQDLLDKAQQRGERPARPGEARGRCLPQPAAAGSVAGARRIEAADRKHS